MKLPPGEGWGKRGWIPGCVPGLRYSKQPPNAFLTRTEPPLDVPSMALRGFGGRPVRQFMAVPGTVKNI